MMTIEEKPVVLVVDDDRSITTLLKEGFTNEGYKVVTATEYRKAVRIIHENSKKRMVALIDFHLPGEKNGRDLIEYISRVAPHRVVIYGMTGGAGDERKKAIAAGAVHVFKKPLDIDDLLDHAESHLVRRLVERATTDGLTGLLRRETFLEIVVAEIQTARRHPGKRRFSLLCIDLDDFKAINDTHGHPCGDEALKVVAKTIQDNVRPSDHPCRLYGGDEFLVWLPGEDLELANNTGRELQEEVARAVIVNDKGEAIRLAISFGAAELRQDEEFEDLFKRADDVLIVAKADKKQR